MASSSVPQRSIASWSLRAMAFAWSALRRRWIVGAAAPPSTPPPESGPGPRAANSPPTARLPAARCRARSDELASGRCASGVEVAASSAAPRGPWATADGSRWGVAAWAGPGRALIDAGDAGASAARHLLLFLDRVALDRDGRALLDVALERVARGLDRALGGQPADDLVRARRGRLLEPVGRVRHADPAAGVAAVDGAGLLLLDVRQLVRDIALERRAARAVARPEDDVRADGVGIGTDRLRRRRRGRVGVEAHIAERV